jgi:hypothetical protein
LGKEFLLFQVLRDDFLSVLVRGCWLVSFLLTPIYMFLLTFIVIFGPKKSTLLAYMSFWNFNYYVAVTLLITFIKNKENYIKLNKYILYRFQQTIFTCRPTAYVLFFFWCFFFFFGESLLLITFNFSTVTDTIPANYFFSFKTQTVFFTSFVSSQLSSIIMFYITFFTCCAFLFLINLRYSFNYAYLDNLWVLDFFFMLFCIFLFSHWLFWLLVVNLLFSAYITQNKK